MPGQRAKTIWSYIGSSAHSRPRARELVTPLRFALDYRARMLRSGVIAGDTARQGRHLSTPSAKYGLYLDGRTY